MPQSTLPEPRRPIRARGFTLMELLVVIGIMALLFALLLPVLSMVNRSADETSLRATLASIETALESYRSDFGDYPRFGRHDPNFPNPLHSAPDRGARLLARAIFGPAPAFDPRLARPTVPSDIAAYGDQVKMAFQDGHGEPAGPLGFKEELQVIQRGSEAAAHYPGSVRQPYLSAERFELRQINDLPDPSGENSSLLGADANFRYGVDAVILDPRNRQPILYYPASTAKLDINIAPNFVNWTDENSVPSSLFNAFDNRGEPGATAPPRREGLNLADPTNDKSRFTLAKLLGDVSQDGAIGPGETAATTGPFLLITGGVDGFRFDESVLPDGLWYVTKPIANFQPAGIGN